MIHFHLGNEEEEEEDKDEILKFIEDEKSIHTKVLSDNPSRNGSTSRNVP